MTCGGAMISDRELKRVWGPAPNCCQDFATRGRSESVCRCWKFEPYKSGIAHLAPRWHCERGAGKLLFFAHLNGEVLENAGKDIVGEVSYE